MASLALELIPEIPVLVSGVTGVVRLVEGLFGHKSKAPLSGPDKKQAALNLSSDLLNLYVTVAPQLGLSGAGTSEVMTAISEFIDSTVKLYNATGVFVHGQKP